MEIKKYIRGKNEYEFVCEYWETSQAWGHKVTMLKNGRELQANKVRNYNYNRTLEIWTFQAAINEAIYKEIRQREIKLLEDYKNNNNGKENIINLINADGIIRELKELKKSINEGNKGGEF